MAGGRGMAVPERYLHGITCATRSRQGIKFPPVFSFAGESPIGFALMSTAQDDEDDEEGVELVPVPMGRKTRERLARFAAALGKQPIHAAGKLMRDLMSDDEFYNAAAEEGGGALH